MDNLKVGLHPMVLLKKSSNRVIYDNNRNQRRLEHP